MACRGKEEKEECQVFQGQLDPLENLVPLVLLERKALLVPLVFQVLMVPLESQVQRVLMVTMVPLDVTELLENVVIVAILDLKA